MSFLGTFRHLEWKPNRGQGATGQGATGITKTGTAGGGGQSPPKPLQNQIKPNILPPTAVASRKPIPRPLKTKPNGKVRPNTVTRVPVAQSNDPAILRVQPAEKNTKEKISSKKKTSIIKIKPKKKRRKC